MGPVHAEIKAAAKHPHESATNAVGTSQLKSSRSSKDPGLFYDAKSRTSKLGTNLYFVEYLGMLPRRLGGDLVLLTLTWSQPCIK